MHSAVLSSPIQQGGQAEHAGGDREGGGGGVQALSVQFAECVDGRLIK